MMKNGVRGAVAALLMTIPAVASAAADIAMHRDPGCGCCEKWAAQVRQQFGRKVQIIDDDRREVLQRKIGLPADLRPAIPRSSTAWRLRNMSRSRT
jgi:hypothetical protein